MRHPFFRIDHFPILVFIARPIGHIGMGEFDPCEGLAWGERRGSFHAPSVAKVVFDSSVFMREVHFSQPVQNKVIAAVPSFKNTLFLHSEPFKTAKTTVFHLSRSFWHTETVPAHLSRSLKTADSLNFRSSRSLKTVKRLGFHLSRSFKTAERTPICRSRVYFPRHSAADGLG